MVEKRAGFTGGDRTRLVADPYLWSGMAPALRAHAVVMNSPWIDANYLPLAPGPDSRLLVNILSDRREREDIDQHDGDLSRISISERKRAFAGADFLFVLGEGLPEEGLGRDLGADAGAWRCKPAGWYALCEH